MNIVDRIAARAVAHRPALMADGLVLHYGDLMERVSVVASWLNCFLVIRGGGVPRVGLACGNGVDYVVLALGILKAGGCLVPLAEELTAAERAELVERTGLCGVVLGSRETWRRGEAAGNGASTGAAWLALGNHPLGHEAEFSALDPAFIRFSSGTTGRSKGVVLSHHKLMERIVAANRHCRSAPPTGSCGCCRWPTISRFP